MTSFVKFSISRSGKALKKLMNLDQKLNNNYKMLKIAWFNYTKFLKF